MSTTWFRTVAELLADTSAARGEGEQWFADEFQYFEAASGATNHHVTTAGGVKLYVQMDADGSLPAGAFGDLSAANASSVLQAAVDAAPGRVVTVPSQIINVGTKITISSDDTTLDLAGATIRVADSSDISVFDVTGDRSGIINGKIDGNRANQPGTSYPAMVILKGEQSFCRDVFIKDSDGYGVNSVDASHSEIKDVTVIDSRYIGIYSVVTEGNGANIEGSNIINCLVDRRGLGASVTEGGIKVHQSGGTVGTYQIEGFLIANCKVYMDTGATDVECYVASGIGGRVSSCYAYGADIGITLVGEDVTCTDFVAQSCGGYGLEITQLVGGAIKGTIIRGGGITERGIAFTSAVDNRSSDITILGSRVQGCTEYALYMRFVDRVTHTGNKYSDAPCLMQDCPHLISKGNIYRKGAHASASLISAVDLEKVSFSDVFADGTNAVNFSSSDANFEPDDVIFTGCIFDNTGQIVPIASLASGAIGEGWQFWGNAGTAPNARVDYISYKYSIVFHTRHGTPVGWLNNNKGSIVTDTANGVTYVKTGGTSSDWEDIGQTP
jgi:hypothetical protein